MTSLDTQCKAEHLSTYPVSFKNVLALKYLSYHRPLIINTISSY